MSTVTTAPRRSNYENRCEMTSGYIPPKDALDLGEILTALRDALNDNPRLAEMPEDEMARQLVLEGYLEGEPSPPLVAETLQAIEAEEGDPTCPRPVALICSHSSEMQRGTQLAFRTRLGEGTSWVEMPLVGKSVMTRE